MTYAEKLRKPEWQKKRLEVFSRDEYRCRDCGSTEKTLHVHHVKYERGEPWEIEAAYLLTLCCDCHSRRESVERKIRADLADSFALTKIETLQKIAERGLKIEAKK